MSGRKDQLAAHVRRLGNHELNELLVGLPTARFAALVEVALSRPVLPAGLVLRFERLQGVDGWTVLACAPSRRLGTVVRSADGDPAGQLAWQAWIAGQPVQAAGVRCWRRRADAVAALAWASPASGARCLALAAYVRALPDMAIQQLMAGLAVDRYDRLLEAAYRPTGSAA
jgi:hypothetical protein